MTDEHATTGKRRDDVPQLLRRKRSVLKVLVGRGHHRDGVEADALEDRDLARDMVPDLSKRQPVHVAAVLLNRQADRLGEGEESLELAVVIRRRLDRAAAIGDKPQRRDLAVSPCLPVHWLVGPVLIVVPEDVEEPEAVVAGALDDAELRFNIGRPPRVGAERLHKVRADRQLPGAGGVLIPEIVAGLV